MWRDPDGIGEEEEKPGASTGTLALCIWVAMMNVPLLLCDGLKEAQVTLNHSESPLF